jgi:FMN phosphatase YigB (HAD superfamily)
MAGFRAVLFDWRGTLAVTMTDTQWVEQAFSRLGRDAGADDIQQVTDAIQDAAAQPELAAAWNRIDCDATFHRSTYQRLFEAARLDAALAAALYEAESDPGLNPFARDVAVTLATAHRRGLKIGVVSDIHFDLRPVFGQQGLSGFVDAFVLSYEHGVQKPDLAIFTAALSELAVTAGETLMVGDRASHDGPAVTAGIPTLLVPPLAHVNDERLHLVLKMTSDHKT